MTKLACSRKITNEGQRISVGHFPSEFARIPRASNICTWSIIPQTNIAYHEMMKSEYAIWFVSLLQLQRNMSNTRMTTKDPAWRFGRFTVDPSGVRHLLLKYDIYQPTIIPYLIVSYLYATNKMRKRRNKSSKRGISAWKVSKIRHFWPLSTWCLQPCTTRGGTSAVQMKEGDTIIKDSFNNIIYWWKL